MPESKRPRLQRARPAKLVVSLFATTIAVGTLLLWSPMSGTDTSLMDAFFTSTSAVCVTGLATVDTATHWTLFGKIVILVLIQVGGFGIMTVGSLVALLLSRRLGLRQKLFTRTETGTLAIGDVRKVVAAVGIVTLAVETVGAIILSFRFAQTTDLGIGASIGHGIFHSVSAFNNAGFALYDDSLIGFATDVPISLTIALAVIIGGLGFPVLVDLASHPRDPGSWSLHTKLTMATTVLLLAVSIIGITGSEWSNPDTLGPMSWPNKLVAGPFAGVMPRTAGFNSVPVGDMEEATLFLTAPLMLIGAGAASTGGGIKVTTFALLAFVIVAELRGSPDVTSFGRRIPTALQRQALSVALIAVGAVVAGTIALMETDDVPLRDALFEVSSAFGTVGLSTGITASLPQVGKLVLVVLMFAGRVGLLTLGTAFVLRSRSTAIRNPEEGLLVG